MGDGGGAHMRALVPTALMVEVASCWRCQAAHVIMVVMVIKGMDRVSANHSCEWKWTHTQMRWLSMKTVIGEIQTCSFQQ